MCGQQGQLLWEPARWEAAAAVPAGFAVTMQAQCFPPALDGGRVLASPLTGCRVLGGTLPPLSSVWAAPECREPAGATWCVTHSDGDGWVSFLPCSFLFNCCVPKVMWIGLLSCSAHLLPLASHTTLMLLPRLLSEPWTCMSTAHGSSALGQGEDTNTSLCLLPLCGFLQPLPHGSPSTGLPSLQSVLPGCRVSCLNLAIVPSLPRTSHGSPLPAGCTQGLLGQAPIRLSCTISYRALSYSPGESPTGDYGSHGQWLDLWASPFQLQQVVCGGLRSLHGQPALQERRVMTIPVLLSPKMSSCSCPSEGTLTPRL